jgi:membrane protein
MPSLSLPRTARTGWQLIKTTALEWKKSQTSVLAASLAYFAVFSLAPLLTLVVMIVGLVYGEAAVKGELVGQIEQVVGGDAAQVMETAIASLRESQNGGLFQVLVSVGVIIFGIYSLFMQIQYSLNKIWRIRPEPSQDMTRFLWKRVLTGLMVFVVVLLVFASFLFNTTMSTLVNVTGDALPSGFPLWRIAGFGLSLVLLTLVFTIVYTVLPDAQVHWRDALVGAVLTTVLLLGGQLLFWQLLERTEFGSAYGIGGSFVILITWIYCAAHVFFIGAEFTRVYALRLGEAIRPESYAVTTDAQLDASR